MNDVVKFLIYRYQPGDKEPFLQPFEVDVKAHRCVMVLDAILYIKNHLDDTLSIRRSCREGVCGSDGVNINGKNGLACVTAIADLKQPIVIRPLPGLPVIRDLIVDMSDFYTQYEKVEPYLQADEQPPAREYLQSPEERDQLDGLYECILCACCTTACPSYWWSSSRAESSDKSSDFLGPSALLQLYRFITDSRDKATSKRLSQLGKPDGGISACHNIMNCTHVCPKGLNPTKAIGHLRREILKNDE